MIVADMLALLSAAKQFAEAAEVSAAAANKLAATCAALQPFRSMAMSAFANLLVQAREYRETGVLPVAGTKPKRATQKPQAGTEDRDRQVHQLVRQLHELFAIVHEETVGFGAIDEVCEAVGKLKAAEVKKVAMEFVGSKLSKASKPFALAEIKRKLTEQKGSAQKTQPIASS
jgi:hypothetical protein